MKEIYLSEFVCRLLSINVVFTVVQQRYGNMKQIHQKIFNTVKPLNISYYPTLYFRMGTLHLRVVVNLA